mmetsp:Transcript_12820/g.41196  ORF Transcript_12820/g.41196 Transcript_12820/m.41196 type:complete len:306 (+) Transcript_12820:1297-2214(+)
MPRHCLSSSIWASRARAVRAAPGRAPGRPAAPKGEARPLALPLPGAAADATGKTTGKTIGGGGAASGTGEARMLAADDEAGIGSVRRLPKLGSHPSEVPFWAPRTRPMGMGAAACAASALARSAAAYASKVRERAAATCEMSEASLPASDRTVCPSRRAKLAVHMCATMSGCRAMESTARSARETVSKSEWKSMRWSSIHMRWSCSSSGGTNRTRCARQVRIGIRRVALDSSASSIRATTSDGAPRCEQTRCTPASASGASARMRPSSCAARNRFANAPSPSRSRMPDSIVRSTMVPAAPRAARV